MENIFYDESAPAEEYPIFRTPRGLPSQKEKKPGGKSCISTTESLLFIPPNPIGDELSSNKSPPPLAIAVLKSSSMVNINFLIQYGSEGSPELSRARL
nr:hypothetical protein CFP56_48644 [Quercus suber]